MSLLGRLFLGLIALLQGVAFTVLIGWQAMVVGVNFGMAACLAVCGVGFVAFFVLLVAHELGHQSAALAVGLPFTCFTVGPLQLVRDRGRVRIRLNTAWYQPAAYVLFALPTGDGWRWRVGAAVAGGPLANLVIAGICLAAACSVNSGPPRNMSAAARQGFRSVALTYPGDTLTAGLNMAGLLSLGFGVGTLLPGSAAGVRTDGGQLLDLCRGKMPQVWGEKTAEPVTHLGPAEQAPAPPRQPSTLLRASDASPPPRR